MILKVKRVHPDSKLPQRAHPTDAGWDIFSATDPKFTQEYIEYDTGLSFEPSEGYHFEVFPRSSVTNKSLILKNGIGLIDWGFRGTLVLRYYGFKNEKGDYHNFYQKGDKIGQIVIRRTEDVEIIEVDTLSETKRGEGSYGSTDKIKK